MRLVIELLFLLVLVGFVVWTLFQRSNLTARQRIELSNLHAFKETARDLALNEIEIDPSNSFARIVLDEVRSLDLANKSGREVS